MDLRDYCILIPQYCGKCIKHAANEFKNFVFRSCTLELEITDKYIERQKYISLGKTCKFLENNFDIDYNLLKDDGFTVRQKDGNVYIDGNYELSVLYGVYDFLEKHLDVRFISNDYTYVPQADGIISDDVETVEIPAFALRSYPLVSMFGKTVDMDFMTRQRNYNNFTELDEAHGYRNLFYARKQGTHNAIFFIPSDEAEKHPEYFWKDEADHGANAGFYHNSMICLTNGITEDGELDENVENSVAKTVINEMIKDFILNPEAKYFIFDQMDGTVRCNCNKCLEAEKKYMRSGILVRFCNIVIKKVQEYSDKFLGGRKFYLSTLAYSYAKNAPLKIAPDGRKLPIDNTVIPSENLVVRLAVAFNAIYSMTDVRQRTENLDTLKDWKMLTKKMFFWGYDCGFDNFLRFFPSHKHIAEDVRYLAKDGNIEYVFMDGCKNSNDWQCSMRSYVYCKLFWNPQLDGDSLIKEFNYHYFGKIACEYIERFMDLFQKHYEYKASIYNTYFQMLKNYKFPQNTDLDVILKAKELVEQAMSEVEEKESGEEKELHLTHLAQVYCMPLFYLLVDYKYYYPDMSEITYLKKAKEWVEWCKKAKIKMYHDMFSVDSFVEAGYKFPY